ncbi:50S ribosomal protein L14e [Candidatus Woesearchaeota archaeon]|nr:50S ribosomal protein L14e [Candidatus Woesearchaeota archaeon]
MFEIGRLCVKIAGRDAGKKCVVIDVLDNNFVLIDGQTRRRKCNLRHLEPLDKIIILTKNASNDEVIRALKEESIECEEKKEAKHKQSQRPTKKKAVNKKLEEAKPKKVKTKEAKETKKENTETVEKAEKPETKKKSVKKEQKSVE